MTVDLGRPDQHRPGEWCRGASRRTFGHQSIRAKSDRLMAALQRAVEASRQILEPQARPVRIWVAADHAHQPDAIRARGAQADARDDVLARARGEAVEISGDRQDRLVHCASPSAGYKLFGSPAIASSTASPRRSTMASI